MRDSPGLHMPTSIMMLMKQPQIVTRVTLTVLVGMYKPGGGGGGGGGGFIRIQGES